jgi:hypothetical protein
VVLETKRHQFSNLAMFDIDDGQGGGNADYIQGQGNPADAAKIFQPVEIAQSDRKGEARKVAEQ